MFQFFFSDICKQTHGSLISIQPLLHALDPLGCFRPSFGTADVCVQTRRSLISTQPLAYFRGSFTLLRQTHRSLLRIQPHLLVSGPHLCASDICIRTLGSIAQLSPLIRLRTSLWRSRYPAGRGSMLADHVINLFLFPQMFLISYRCPQHGCVNNRVRLLFVLAGWWFANPRYRASSWSKFIVLLSFVFVCIVLFAHSCFHNSFT